MQTLLTILACLVQIAMLVLLCLAIHHFLPALPLGRRKKKDGADTSPPPP